ncbi:MAG: DUF3575 domain-containing protein [Chitinophagaceae bacterium]|nr:DUF3575 domain-containing protein [Chitinophagaceae bacterium]
MRKALTSTLLFSFCSFAVNSQKKMAFKWSPSGLYAGNISIQGEFAAGKQGSINIKAGIPSKKNYTPKFDDKDADFDVQTTSFLAGYRIYFSKRRLHGYYIEPYFKNVRFSASGNGNTTLDNQPVVMNFNGDYKGNGIGIQSGVQFTIAKILVLDLYFLGPEYNISQINFKSVEVTNTIPWNNSQAGDAEQKVRDFLDNIPVIGKKVNFEIDRNNRTITADYKGLLPGFRAGIAVGIMF